MEQQTAIRIIRALAQGIDPQTGELFAEGTVYRHPATSEALGLALLALEAPAARGTRSSPVLPENAGKPWNETDDRALVEGFDGGRRIPELADEHKRTRAAIEARLMKLGRLAPADGKAPRFRIASPVAAYTLQ